MLNITVTPVSIGGPSYGPSFSFSYKTIVSVAAPTGSPSLENGKPLSIPWHNLPQDPSIFALLSWHTRTSDFSGRTDEMAKLKKWALGERRVSIQFITGEGGAGKSRLAVEFAESLRTEGWAAGFVDLRSPQNYIGNSNGTLLVVDYPEEHRSAVKELFQDLIALQDVDRLRVLFLTRQAISGWDELMQTTRTKTLLEMAPIRLGALDVDAAHDIYLSISDKTGEVLNRDWQPVDPEAMEDWLNEAPENDRALFIMAAGTYNVLASGDPVVKYKGSDIIESLVERELGRLQNSATDCGLVDQHLFAKLVAVATIAIAIPWDKIGSVLDQIGSESGHADPMALKTPLQEAALLVNGQISSLKPDIVAAIFLGHVLSRMGKQAPELIWSGLNLDIPGGLQRLARLSYDAEFFLREHRWRLRHYLADAVKGNINRAKLLGPHLLSSQLPVSLLDVAVAAWKILLQEANDEKTKAFLFNNLALHLPSLGKKTEALLAAQRAVKIYERLAAANPDAYEPALAMSLNNLGTLYTESVEQNAALSTAKQAVEINERLVATNPDVYENNLAMSLNTMGNRYAGLGNHNAALSAAQRTVEIYERLAAANPDAYETGLAMSLNSLGRSYSELGQHSEALLATQRAVEIYERLAAANPDAYEPDLAGSLSNLGALYINFRKRSAAISTAQQAVEINKRLAAANPDTYEPALATSLANLGKSYSEFGKRSEAVSAMEQAVEIYERLAAANPDAYEPDLAMCYGNLGNRYSELGQRSEAFLATKQAVEIYQRLAAAYPDAYEPNLAMCLNNLGNRYSELGQRSEALSATQRAAEIYERLAAANPDAYEPDLAMTYGTLGSIHSRSKDLRISAQSFQKGITILKRLFLQHPPPFINLMMILLKDYLKTNEALKQTPDMTLLTDILEVLENLKENEN